MQAQSMDEVQKFPTSSIPNSSIKGPIGECQTIPEFALYALQRTQNQKVKKVNPKKSTFQVDTFNTK
jgi:hypothetical protein